MVLDIIVQLANKVSMILVIAFLLSKIKLFKNILLKNSLSSKDKFFLTIIFSIFGIIGAYYGIPIKNAIANSSITGVVAGGLLGGAEVGIGTSLVVALYRLYMGGYVAPASALTTIAAGTLSGMLNPHFLKMKNKGTYAFVVALVCQIFLFLMILLLAKPFEAAKELVSIIAFPMIAVNSFGVAIFISILDNIFHEQDKVGASTAQLALDIANKTLPYLRHGLDFDNAQKAVEIIYHMVNHVSAVAMTRGEVILAHIGTGVDHHSPKDKIMNRSTKQVLSTGEYTISQTREEIGCRREACELMAAITVPLRMNDQVAGTLLLYKDRENSINSVDIQLALGLAQLFSTQLEISEAENKERLLERAELRALQAQVNPHFLFNALNTIVSYTRTDADIARKLLIHLGNYFRNNLQKVEDFIDFHSEIKNIQSYLAIEEARFGHKMKVIYHIEDHINCQLPPLIIQPIVENAVKHGLLPKKTGGTITINAKKDKSETIITITDDGIGMSAEKIKSVLNHPAAHQRIGMRNVDKRLRGIYGERSGLIIESEPQKGTKVTIRIPTAL
ncbi:two-component system, LytT family, sensor histidine kinase LytS [Geosporobacter subterraneus DSM 17957]|uniref:histidine kinase n=1 Tax=Geosporobacter subterraneus DSM 17957 TaxID=1121919 RepID=A0A1M6IGG0_9FIRM|nr:LytS/YhcK type 5TM receptor domain-containing protein [Geosporobacter subterraneus]SHJ33446.1 two-component system, LytT family, sensor histidine kinase LytS [Geosporobacter subterraneus DSM 17957]